VHDLQSLRATPYEDGFPEPGEPLVLERQAIEGCAALVTVSEEMEEAACSRYRLPQARVRFANYALERDLPAVLPDPSQPSNGPPRIVYQGTLSTNGGHYDLRDVFREIVDGGARLDIYPSRPSPAYEELAAGSPGMRCLPKLNPRALLEALTQYAYGWAGFNATLNAAHLDTALPNKIFEYLGCGLPVLTLGHRAIARLVREHGVGLVLDSPADLRRRLDDADLEALRRRAAEARASFTVEANIGLLADLYKRLAG
jgi:glycosyltransferase involved in cell wall biosynthesis